MGENINGCGIKLSRFLQIAEAKGYKADYRHSNLFFEGEDSDYDLASMLEVLGYGQCDMCEEIHEIERGENFAYDEETNRWLCGACEEGLEEAKGIFKVDDKVEFTEEWDAYPHFQVKKFSAGTVTSNDSGEIMVQMDNPIKGCEEWDNQVQMGHDERMPEKYLRKIIQRSDLEKQLLKFRAIAFKVSEVWEQAQANTKDEISLTEGYPFQHSFDEMAHEISDWVENAVNDGVSQ